MELTDAMRSTFACRHYLPKPVPDRVFYEAVDAARFGPQGGNRQPVRFVIVRDDEKKRALGELYKVAWRRFLDARPSGPSSETPVAPSRSDFAESFGRCPAIVVVCANLAATHPTDLELDRISIVAGASIYPLVQNFCLAMRNLGVATTLTTLLVEQEPAVKSLLGIPEDWVTACHLAAGYPADGFPTKLRRLPVEELAFVDTFGIALAAEDAGRSGGGYLTR
ncbi:MAG TPA: nitroreductase family protein [Solirubrobacterales bacterium]